MLFILTTTSEIESESGEEKKERDYNFIKKSLKTSLGGDRV